MPTDFSFPTPLQEFIYRRTYSRWLPDQNRRENFPETVDRYLQYFADQLPAIKPVHARTGRKALLDLSVMPSMRALWAAGPAAASSNVTLYNCSYLPIADLQSFSETLYILMCGTGVGFSVESRFVSLLPELSPPSGRIVPIIVDDSREGWAKGLRDVMVALWAGHDVQVDTSKIRPRGARLKTMGGRASGPEPLIDLFDFLKRLINKRVERKEMKLLPINCLDIVCKIAEVVVVGGVRRSSLICLFDADDQRVAGAKQGEFWRTNQQRMMSNNSGVFEGVPAAAAFLKGWLTLMEAGTGEPGCFNRAAALQQMVFSGRRKPDKDVGTNPCGEILLKPYEFCNLSEVVCRPTDTLDTLRQKVRVATMFGCWQATQTKFPFLRKVWTTNCRQERLLGVSLTGIMDHPVLNNVSDKAKKWLSELRYTAIKEAGVWSKKLGIPMPAAICCVKPSGTVSQLVDSASGIHPRFSQHYVRRYRIAATDPLLRMLQSQGVQCFPEVGQEPHSANTWVVEFPVAAPVGTVTANEFKALDQLAHWKMVKDFWCEHNPSITVYVGEDEWLEVGTWCYKNFNSLLGVSFLPRSQHVYRLAPYEAIPKERYDEMASAAPKIDFSKLTEFETEDSTTGQSELACVSGVCDL